jgi:flagellar hook-associated protein 3 FlgL
MRITNGMILNDVLANQSLGSQQVARLTQEASSGVKVGQPSDDPAAYGTVVSYNAQISIMTARGSAITSASNDLQLADGALSSATDLVTQAQQLATEAASGTEDASSRANMAAQANEIVSQMIAVGNTQGANGYIFGGTKTDTPPFDSTGAFNGNAESTQVEVANGVVTTSNASGALAFTAAGGRDVIGDLQALATALSGNDVAGIQASLTNLSADNSQIVDARVNAGDIAQQLQSSSAVITSSITTEQSALASVADVDIPTVYSQLTTAQASYENALSVNRQVLTMFQQEMSISGM